MSGKAYFWMIASVLLGLTGGLLLLLLLGAAPVADNRHIWLLAAEAALLLLLSLLLLLYRKVVRPLDVLSGGIDLLREQDFSTRMLPVGQRDADRIVQLFNRMSDQLREDKLRVREQNELLDLLIEASPVGLLILDHSHGIVSANTSLCRMLEIPDIAPYVGRVPADTGLPLLRGLSADRQPGSLTVQTDPLHIYKCSLSFFMDRGFSRPFYMFEPLTEELFQAEKKGYRRVIRVISHEVNNTVTGVSSSLALVREDALERGDGDLAEMLSVILTRIGRMTQFITNYADLVKIPEPMLLETDATSFLRGLVPFLESLRCGRPVTLTLEASSDPNPLRLDPVLMEQVFVNLVKNAIEAFPADSGPADSGPGDSGLQGSGSDFRVSQRIWLVARPGYWCVADNGRPISPQVAEHLFTPFFSTKPDGQGIGLTLIREILTRHGFHFRFSTHPDGITRFEIFTAQSESAK